MLKSDGNTIERNHRTALKGARNMKFMTREFYLVQSKENLSVTEDIPRQEVRKEGNQRAKSQYYS